MLKVYKFQIMIKNNKNKNNQFLFKEIPTNTRVNERKRRREIVKALNFTNNSNLKYQIPS